MPMSLSQVLVKIETFKIEPHKLIEAVIAHTLLTLMSAMFIFVVNIIMTVKDFKSYR